MTVLLVLSMVCAFATIGTYLLLTTGKVKVRVYDWVNVVAAVPIIAYAALRHAWPSVTLSTSYLLVAGYGLFVKWIAS